MQSIHWLQAMCKDDLTPSETLVLFCLVMRDRNRSTSGVVWPSIRTICGDTGLARSTVYTALHGLQDKGRVTTATGRNGGNRYTLQIGVGVQDTDRGVQILDTGGPDPEQRGPDSGPGRVREGIKEKGKVASDDATSATTPDWVQLAEGEPVKAEDVLAQQQPPQNPAELVEYYRERTRPRQLGFFWRAMVAHHYPEMRPTVPLTAAEEAQIRKVYREVPDFHESVAKAVGRWVRFTTYCEEMHGAYKTPAKPTLAFLVKYRQALVAWAPKQPLQTSAQAKPAPKPEPKPAPAQSKPPEPEDDKPQTWEELVALIEGTEED